MTVTGTTFPVDSKYVIIPNLVPIIPTPASMDIWIEVGFRVRVLMGVIEDIRMGLRNEELKQRREVGVLWSGRWRVAAVVVVERWWSWGVTVVVIEEIRPATDMAYGR